MPRDASGNYTLPLGNPVADGTIIDVNWANPTMADIAVQLNNVITRDGLLGFTAPVKIVDGNAGSPGLQFVSEASTGLYRGSSASMSVSITGTEQFQVNTQGIYTPSSVQATRALMLPGTPAAPAFTFVGDADTGFYSPSDGVVVFVSNGVEVMRWSASGVTNTVPVGTVIDFAGPVPPAGYVLCDGTAYSRVVYAALFAAIGTTWGVGDGSSTFNVPDLRRTTTIGAGGSNLSGPGPAVGNKGGTETVTLDTTMMPSHAHGVSDPTHAHGVNDGTHAHGVSDPGHAHSWPHQGALTWGAEINNRGLSTAGAYNDQGPITATNGAFTGLAIAGAFANISIQGAGTGIAIAAAGGDVAHSNMQPSAVMNKIIKI